MSKVKQEISSQPRSGRGGARVRAGRPPKLSQEMILEAGVRLMERHDAKFTVSEVASAVGATPMAIYRYYPDRRALVDAVVDWVLGTLDLNALESAEVRPDSWEWAVEHWARQLRSHVLRYPAVPNFLTEEGRYSPGWLNITGQLALILEKAGFRLEVRGTAVTYAARTIIGAIQSEINAPMEREVAAAIAALSDVEDDSARNLLARHGHPPKNDLVLVDITIRSLIRTLEELRDSVPSTSVQ